MSDVSPPGSAGATVGRANIRSKARWFCSGTGIVVLGFVIAFAVGTFGFVGSWNTISDFERISEGTGTVRIDSAGDYVIYAEDGSSSGRVDLTTPDGEPIAIDPYANTLTYDQGNRSGQAVGTFEARSTGDYTVATDRDIAIGPSIAGDLVRTIVIPLAIAGLGLLLGLVVKRLTRAKHLGSKKRPDAAG